ncbi:MAG: GNAT family N-acetyltransferase [Beijerinckiaceae bacterium]
MASGITIRALTLNEMRVPIEWAAREGWNPGLHDAEPFHAADPFGHLAAFIGGEPVACISAVRSGDDFGFVGFYICRPDMRGSGIGWAVWQAGMAYLAGRTIGLDGVVAQQDNYRKSGFEFAHRNVRYQGRPSSQSGPDLSIRRIAPDMIDAVTAYDRSFYPAQRSAFLRLWLQPREGMALACVEDGQIVGYGVIRRCRDGHKIGPLFAAASSVAERLFVALTGALPADSLVILDVPEPNLGAVAMAQRFGLAPVFETARMYRGADPQLPLSRIFGITSFELG